MSSRIATVSTVIVAIAGANAAQGTPVTFAFEGDIAFVQDQFGLLGGQVSVGDSSSGSYTFESATVDSDPGEPRRGLYVNALSALSGQVNNVYFEAVPGFASSITVEDGFLHPSYDAYGAVGNINLAGWTIGFSIGLFDNAGLAFDIGGDSLPITPPNLATFSSTRFTFASEPAGLLILGELTALVPEPTSLVILGLGSSVFLTRRRKQSRSTSR